MPRSRIPKIKNKLSDDEYSDLPTTSGFISPSPRPSTPTRPTRISKRSIILSVLGTFLCYWLVLPRLFFIDENDHFEEQVFDYRPKNKEWRVKHPVIMIPGIFSSGLELWQGEECATKNIRHRQWGSMSMFRMIFKDKKCWLKHLRLHRGGDPPGIKLRATLGIEAADWFFPGYNVWAKMVRALAAIGYDHETLQMSAFDWRLDIGLMETRDRYFTRLKASVELMVRLRREAEEDEIETAHKAVILCHSAGMQVWYYFMQWVTHQDPTWIDKHVHAVVSIGGSYLGLVKGVGGTWGDYKETSRLNKLKTMFVESVVNVRERTSIVRSWLNLFTFSPIGGKTFWPNPLATIRGSSEGDEEELKIGPYRFRKHYYADDIIDLMEQVMPEETIARARRLYNSQPARSAEELRQRANDTASWYNPLATALPNAPNMRIYCFYGVGIPTEVGYAYLLADDIIDTDDPSHQRSLDAETMMMPLRIDTDLTDPVRNVTQGIFEDEMGDGTVSLLSNGYMCTRAWPNSKLLNPSGIHCINKEFQDQASNSASYLTQLLSLKEAPRTDDHVGIMGNEELIDDILAIVSGHEQGIENRFYSDIREQSAKIDLEILN